MDIKQTPIFGSLVDQNPLMGAKHPSVAIGGVFKSQPAFLNLDEDILSKHLMLIGGTGSGKSNVFYHLIAQIKKQLTPNDVMIIFDTKGDYYNLFKGKNDIVIGNSSTYYSISEKWNIFKEITADGWDEHKIEMNTNEISWSIFNDTIEKSKDPFFPNAARDLFASIISLLIMNGRNDKKFREKNFYNSELKKAIEGSTILEIKNLIETQPSLKSVLSYIGDGTNGQALGVYADLLGTFRKLFTGIFAENGLFSIRNFIHAKGGRTLFIEYDLSIGSILSPIYSLLFDLALKESLGRSHKEGNVYLICDEFKLLPHLEHIDDGINFGRSLGVKVIAGLQSINQLTEIYGEQRGKNIAAGFSTYIAFRANDVHTREFVTNLHGKNYVMERYKTLTNTIKEENRNANVVEDWHMIDLEVGEAIIGLPFRNPFKFKFNLYK